MIPRCPQPTTLTEMAFLGINRAKSTVSVIFFDKDKPDVSPMDAPILRAMNFKAVLIDPEESYSVPYTGVRLLRNLAVALKHFKTEY